MGPSHPVTNTGLKPIAIARANNTIKSRSRLDTFSRSSLGVLLVTTAVVATGGVRSESGAE